MLKDEDLQGRMAVSFPFGVKDCQAHALGIHLQAHEATRRQAGSGRVLSSVLGWLALETWGQSWICLVSKITFDVASHRTLI